MTLRNILNDVQPADAHCQSGDECSAGSVVPTSLFSRLVGKDIPRTLAELEKVAVDITQSLHISVLFRRQWGGVYIYIYIRSALPGN